jgi:hypothetical protein
MLSRREVLIQLCKMQQADQRGQLCYGRCSWLAEGYLYMPVPVAFQWWQSRQFLTVKRRRLVLPVYLSITASEKGKTSQRQTQPHLRRCGMSWCDTALTCRYSNQAPIGTCHCLIYFCMCDIGVHVISCLDNYIMTVTNASLISLHLQEVSVDRLSP